MEDVFGEPGLPVERGGRPRSEDEEDGGGLGMKVTAYRGPKTTKDP